MNAEPAKEGAATPGWVRDLEKRRQQVKTHELWNIFCSYKHRKHALILYSLTNWRTILGLEHLV
jgi:hypothetical protein